MAMLLLHGVVGTVLSVYQRHGSQLTFNQLRYYTPEIDKVFEPNGEAVTAAVVVAVAATRIIVAAKKGKSVLLIRWKEIIWLEGMDCHGRHLL